MDDVTLRSLHVALAATPDNTALRVAIIRALVGRGDRAAAVEQLDGRAATEFAPADRAFLAGLLIDSGAPARALSFAGDDNPGDGEELLLARARALHALGERDAALAAYTAAVTRNPTLEDRDLRAQLGATVREHDDGPVRLRVVS